MLQSIPEGREERERRGHSRKGRSFTQQPSQQVLHASIPCLACSSPPSPPLQTTHSRIPQLAAPPQSPPLQTTHSRIPSTELWFSRR